MLKTSAKPPFLSCTWHLYSIHQNHNYCCIYRRNTYAVICTSHQLILTASMFCCTQKSQCVHQYESCHDWPCVNCFHQWKKSEYVYAIHAYVLIKHINVLHAYRTTFSLWHFPTRTNHICWCDPVLKASLSVQRWILSSAWVLKSVVKWVETEAEWLSSVHRSSAGDYTGCKELNTNKLKYIYLLFLILFTYLTVCKDHGHSNVEHGACMCHLLANAMICSYRVKNRWRTLRKLQPLGHAC